MLPRNSTIRTSPSISSSYINYDNTTTPPHRRSHIHHAPNIYQLNASTRTHPNSSFISPSTPTQDNVILSEIDPTHTANPPTFILLSIINPFPYYRCVLIIHRVYVISPPSQQTYHRATMTLTHYHCTMETSFPSTTRRRISSFMD